MRKIIFILFALASGLFTACQGTDVPETPDTGGFQSTNENSFKLQITVPGTQTGPQTRVSPIQTESDIYSLHLVFFERTTDGSGAYKGFYSVDIDQNSPLDIANPVQVEFEESTGLTNTESYNVFLVANLDWYVNGQTMEQWIASLQTMTESMAKEATRAYIKGQPDETVYTEGLTRLPMSASASKEAYVSTINVLLNRIVARIDVINYVNATYDLVSGSIWNGFPYSSVWQGNVDYSAARVQRYYGILTEPTPDGRYESIESGLYCFENYVVAPEMYDALTTCVIIGMRNLDPTASDYQKILYYRINIHSTGNPQDLKRNRSYSITVRGVLDRGYPTELEAYRGETDKLDIVINYWDLDDDGIIQYDGDNVLAVPMKRINIPREGDEREYSIFTLGDGNKLALTRNTVPTGIDVRLEGNMLYVVSQPLSAGQTSRGGEIDLIFGALKATVYINQSGDNSGDYIELTPAALTFFPAYGVTTSETITVDASGAWTAKLYNEGFSFSTGSVVTEFRSTQGDSFTISTTGSNHENSSRLGFVVISLDDKASVNRSLVLQQRGVGGLTVTPEQPYVYFNADGTIHISNKDTFMVDPGDNGYGVINPWTVELANDQYFQISSRKYDPDNVSGNTFTVSARGENTSVSQRTTNLKVYITDEPNVSFQIPVIQVPYTLSVNPTTFNTVPAAGGTAGPVSVTCTQNRNWTATVSTTTEANGHSAMLVDARNNQSTTLTGTTGDTFSISFPRVNTPNISPVATVTVTLDGTDLKKTFTVTQTSLVPRALRFNSKGTSYGTLMSSYAGYKHINVFGDNLFNTNYFGPYSHSVVKTAGAFTNTHGYSKPINTAITNFHVNQGTHDYRNAIVEWLGKDHRNFMTVCLDIDHADHQKLLKLLSSSYAVKATTVGTSTVRSLSQTPQAYRNNKVWEYLTKTGPFTEGVEININKTAFYNGDAANGSLSGWPSTTIPIIMHPTNSSYCMLAVDPVHKLVIIGDTEMFCNRNAASNKTDFTVGNDNWKFLNNLLAFIVNAGMYGDDFLNEFR